MTMKNKENHYILPETLEGFFHGDYHYQEEARGSEHVP
jgi:hypothetical protein